MGICPELIIFCCFLMGSYRELFRRDGLFTLVEVMLLTALCNLHCSNVDVQD
jgi:hypothetical protein